MLEKRVKIPEYLKSSSDMLEAVVEEYTEKDTGKVRYRELVEDLRTFDYGQATTEK